MEGSHEIDYCRASSCKITDIFWICYAYTPKRRQVLRFKIKEDKEQLHFWTWKGVVLISIFEHMLRIMLMKLPQNTFEDKTTLAQATGNADPHCGKQCKCIAHKSNPSCATKDSHKHENCLIFGAPSLQIKFIIQLYISDLLKVLRYTSSYISYMPQYHGGLRAKTSTISGVIETTLYMCTIPLPVLISEWKLCYHLQAFTVVVHVC